MSKGLSKLNDEFVKCRAWGHEWEDFIPIGRRAAWGILISLRCARCTTERYDTIDINGDLSAREYKHPDGYKIAGTTKGDRIPIGDIRLEVIKRLRKPRDESNVVKLRRVK